MSSQALACYRNLLRARAAAFRGDRRAITAARDEIRQYFEEVSATNRTPTASSNTTLSLELLIEGFHVLLTPRLLWLAVAD